MSTLEAAGGFTSWLVTFAIAMACDGLIFWILMKVLRYDGGSFVRCFWCSVLLQAVSILSLFVLFFPLPIVNYFLFLVVWYKASNFVIEGTFDLRDGSGRSILIAYICVSILIHGARRFLFA